MEELIQVNSISAGYPVKTGFFGKYNSYNTILENISLSFVQGKTVGLVGESGSGKTTLGRAVLGLLPVLDGSIYYIKNNQKIKISGTPEKDLRPLRKNLQIVFQDPFSSLNPRLKISDILCEGLKYHAFNKQDHNKLMLDALNHVGLAKNALGKFPHEFSGGQRQRISIARAIILKPEFIVLDECVSALDVSIQAQIINLLIGLQKEMNLTYLFISHDISVVRHISHTIAVIYNGKIIEIGDPDQITNRPENEYTKALIHSIPKLHIKAS
ncbi:MAG: ATP-binding cassette domain-containing protein [Spirochaetia bacterium]|nr:ATP-binding cassette domain-containing protein [Spirochaetia bacterium]